MKDEAAGIGHNQPPDTEFEDLRAKVNEFGQAAVEWGESEITSDEDAEKINDFIEGSRALYKKADALRKERKQPHDEAAKAVQAAFKPILDAIQKASSTAKDRLSIYLRRKERELAEQRRKEAEEAARREAEAQAAAAEAEQQGDMVAAAEAEDQAQEAAKAVEKATADDAHKARVGSASGAGRTASMRTVRTAKVANIALALAHYRTHPEIVATVERLANADIRAAKGGPIEIPGVVITEERRVA